ncbi:MAG TPA: RodZ domain-containing protein [Vicinamibacterales bacterium]|jgi:cytoskeletal protein RodZ
MDIGAELRAAREAKGLSIRTLADRTRVQARTLAAIELNNLAAIPPRPFGRGFVRAFAKEVDLDPDQTVHSYFSQFPPTSLASAPAVARTFERADEFDPRPSPLAGLATAAIILIVLVGAAVMIGRRSEPAATSNAPVGTTGATVPAPRADAAPAARPAPAPVQRDAAAAAPSAAPLRLTFTVSRPCWVAASTDGTRVVYRILQAGERQTLDAQREIAIRFGDAGAVAWTLNGRNGAALGDAGAVRDLRITPENAATIK